MWAFLSSRIRTLVVAAVLVPVVGWTARKLADRSEAKHQGATVTSRALRSVEGFASRRRRKG